MGKGGGNYGKRENVGAKSSSQEFFPAWARDATECEEKYQVKRKFGLSSDEVEKRRQIYGRNELEKHEGTSIFKMILKHFNNQLVRILLVVAVTSFVLAWYDAEEGEQIEMWKYVEPLVIFSVLIVNAIVGIWQESNAEKALEALKEIQSKQVNVIRNAKKVINLPAKELVPGDIVELRVGDKVPADMRVLSLISSTVRVEQGSLTGESEAVSKTSKPVAENSDIRGKKCMVFSGTTVVNGNCICLVTQTGMNTELGKVHSQIHKASQIEDDDTPLKKKLNEFGEVLTIVIGMLCALVWLINVKYFLSWEYVDGWPRNFKFSFIKCKYYLKIAAALAVAAIPEGLPAVITTCLALGTRKMAQKKAIVRKLPSIETLGCTTVICIDKTGTLTTNQMVVSKLVAMGPSPGTLRSFDVEGTTYNPFYGKILDWPVGEMDANLQMIAKVAAVCNDAVVEQSGSHFISTGTPTEAALKVLVEKMGLPEFHRSSEHVDPQRCSQLWNKMEKRIATLEFDRDRKSMGVIVNSSSGRKSLLVKGAVENLLERCTHVQLLDGSAVDLDPYFKKLILRNLHEMSTEGLRCLGFAYKDLNSEFGRYNGDEDHPAHQLLLNPSNYSSIERNLIFVGLVGLWDPPREEVRQAIEDCKAAGIRVMVITGDNKNTAEAICREIGVFESHEDITCKSLTAKEFMDHPDQICHLRQSGSLLFSRAEPSHKHEIVRLLKEDGEVVAMTGDGVNDAPALKLADIGVAMGVVGTEVAKEASDMVLADDNFSTIVAAVGEGRSIFNNIKAFIRYFISSNIGMVASIFLTSTLGIPEVLTPVQLLWSNMVDGIPATALGFNPPDKDAMKKPPRRNNTLITPWILFRHLVIGSYIMIEKVGIFIIWYTHQTFLGIDLSGDGRTLVTYSQLANFGQCSSWKNFTVSAFTAGPQVFKFDTNPCDYFHSGKIKATALSFSLLIVIKLFNSLNAISEDQSLLTMPPWVNPWLLLAASTSLGMHFLIFYVPITSKVLRIVPLSLNEWLLVMALSFPVILIDEILKFIGRVTSQLWNDRPNKLKAE